MRYDPCGQGVAMLRTGYTARVRPWRDAPGDVEIRWYKCPPGARALGVPSLFRSLHWESHPYLFANGLGEVFQSVTKVYPYKAPPGVTGQHRCGTDEDFAKGGHFTTEEPPYPRGDDGIAECCRPPLGCLIIDGTGVGAPDVLEADSRTDFVFTSGTTVFAPATTTIGTAGVVWAQGTFVTTDESALFLAVPPGKNIRASLSSRDEGLTWLLLWSDGGGMTAFMGTGPVHHTDQFEGVAPAWATRLIIGQTGGPFLGDTLWWGAANVIPDPP